MSVLMDLTTVMEMLLVLILKEVSTVPVILAIMEMDL